MNDWLRAYAPRHAPRVRLVCFPHAGGNASFYHSWHAHLPEHVELHAVQYPGRHDRVSEPLVRRMDEMADRAAKAIAPLARRGPVVLFGHSLGASVAHEVARRLAVRPAALVVSGRPAPDRLRDTAVHLADDDTLWAEMGRLGGTEQEALDHPVLRELTLPILRADYEVAETYQPPARERLPAPIMAFIGDRDVEVSEDEARAWSEYTRGGFRLAVFPGGHFYLVPRERDVVAALVRTCAPWGGDGP
ncbi:thioesterase II family protein [Planotetraspora sp. GP83]|uniref:thioesterase II family protein n=1 Tax=Planotetraspora sp. GP83 TaxID=3156264 RepID=UPI003514E092